MGSSKLILIWFLASGSFGLDLFGSKKLTLTLDKFEGTCPGTSEKNAKVYLRNHQTKVGSNGLTVVDYDFVFKEDAPKTLSSSWSIQKCRNKESPDTCIPFTTIKTSKFCDALVSKDEMWRAHFKCFTPQMACPIKKGVYVGKNCSMDATRFSMFPVGGSFWKVRVEIIHPRSKAVLGCFILDAGVAND